MVRALSMKGLAMVLGDVQGAAPSGMVAAGPRVDKVSGRGAHSLTFAPSPGDAHAGPCAASARARPQLAYGGP